LTEVAPALTAAPEVGGAEYLRKAEQAPQSDKFAWALIGAKAYFRDNQPQPANAVIAKLQRDAATDEQQAALQLAQAQGLKFQERFDQALSVLNFNPMWSLTDPYWVNYYTLQAALYQIQRNPISAAQALIQLDRYLHDEVAQVNNRKAIWDLLDPLSPFILRSFQQPGQDIQNGWFELSAISNEPVKRPEQLRKMLEGWLIDYPGHPATAFVETDLAKVISRSPYRPQHIAVLLPLTGKYSANGISIRDGIIAAHFDEQQENAPQLVFFDTNKRDIPSIAAELQSGGYDFVLGPLLKPNVEALRQQAMTQPWLSFNENSEQGDLPESQYSFALTPENEATQAAEFIASQGHLYPLVLAPNTSSGIRTAQAFQAAWQESHGRLPAVTYYGNRSEIQSAVKSLLHTDQSQQRISQIKQLLGTQIKAEQRSRRDTQAVYLIASNTDAKLILPFINVTISPFSEPLSLYAPSRSHSEASNNRELDELIVSEMPWMLDTSSVNVIRFNQLWPKADDLSKRLYAMGYDGYKLIPELNLMRGLKDYQIDGLTGGLSVKASGEITRHLTWSQYHNGKLKPLQLVSSVIPQVPTTQPDDTSTF
jgi:outer membrane PBP1 activator LpoA protein